MMERRARIAVNGRGRGRFPYTVRMEIAGEHGNWVWRDVSVASTLWGARRIARRWVKRGPDRLGEIETIGGDR